MINGRVVTLYWDRPISIYNCAVAPMPTRAKLLAATRFAGVTVRLVSLEGLEAEDPTPAEVALALARIAHEHRAIVADGLDAVGHGRHRIYLASYLSHLP